MTHVIGQWTLNTKDRLQITASVIELFARTRHLDLLQRDSLRLIARMGGVCLENCQGNLSKLGSGLVIYSFLSPAWYLNKCSETDLTVHNKMNVRFLMT